MAENKKNHHIFQLFYLVGLASIGFMKNLFKHSALVAALIATALMFMSCKKKLASRDVTMVKIPDTNLEVMTTEVTQGLYEEIMGVNPSHFKGRHRPVEHVSWYDAIYFCNKLSEKYGYAPVYYVNDTADVTKWDYKPHQEDSIEGELYYVYWENGFRLPTNIEWEFAASGGEDYEYSGSNDLHKVGWFNENSGNKTHPVAKKKPNAYGLYDMSGNVREWVQDINELWKDKDPQVRGGSYANRKGFTLDNMWDSKKAWATDRNLGFRVVRTVD
ncbi:MAG: SUMF1/EgtB/PvdO family nonheme iron enzyme [Treponema sp.]|nr:SUMF1/EgtB/PvdO family nonheme iron enzyme [Treponema sp.]